jgi:hypothetical protein
MSTNQPAQQSRAISPHRSERILPSPNFNRDPRKTISTTRNFIKRNKSHVGILLLKSQNNSVNSTIKIKKNSVS